MIELYENLTAWSSQMNNQTERITKVPNRDNVSISFPRLLMNIIAENICDYGQKVKRFLEIDHINEATMVYYHAFF